MIGRLTAAGRRDWAEPDCPDGLQAAGVNPKKGFDLAAASHLMKTGAQTYWYAGLDAALTADCFPDRSAAREVTRASRPELSGPANRHSPLPRQAKIDFGRRLPVASERKADFVISPAALAFYVAVSFTCASISGWKPGLVGRWVLGPRMGQLWVRRNKCWSCLS